MHVMEYKLRFLLNSLTLRIVRIKDLTDVERILRHQQYLLRHQEGAGLLLEDQRYDEVSRL